VTAPALEHDPPGGSVSPARAQRIGAWIEAGAAAAKSHRQVTVDELAEEIPALEEARGKAAAVLEEAYRAMQGPQGDIAAADAEIAGADADRAKWQVKLSDETRREERARARFQHAECESDIARFQQKREFAQAQLLPLRDAWNKARAEYELAAASVSGRELNATLELAYFGAGQKTAAYGMRFGMALERALRDRDDYEHDAAVGYMLHLCEVSGFRTEDYSDVLPSDAEQARRSWDQVYADPAAYPREPVPSGRDVLAMDTAEILNAALERSPSKIDDYRGARPPVPRNERVPEYRQTQSLRDLGLG
jgi:hypothetical protein